METIARYSTLIEAQSKRAFLESSGVDAFIPDEMTVQMNWMYVNAIGGIRLQVPEESVIEALEILGLEADTESALVSCPECGSVEIAYLQMSFWTALFYLIIGVFLPFRTRKVTCMQCKAVFKYNETKR
ncbi:MAG: DUF2007 domain-containing protein [Opitutales bacterium]